MYQRLSVLVIALSLVTPARAFAVFTSRGHASGSVHSAHNIPKASTSRQLAPERQGKAPFEGSRDRATSFSVDHEAAKKWKNPSIVIRGTDVSHLHPLIKEGCGASADCYQHTWRLMLERPDLQHIFKLSADAAAPHIKKLTQYSWRRTESDLHTVRLLPSIKSTVEVTGDSQINAAPMQQQRLVAKKRFVVKNAAFDDQVTTGSAPIDIEAAFEHFRVTHPHLSHELDRLTAPTVAPDPGGRPSKFSMQVRDALGEQQK